HELPDLRLPIALRDVAVELERAQVERIALLLRGDGEEEVRDRDRRAAVLHARGHRLRLRFRKGEIEIAALRVEGPVEARAAAPDGEPRRTEALGADHEVRSVQSALKLRAA